MTIYKLEYEGALMPENVDAGADLDVLIARDLLGWDAAILMDPMDESWSGWPPGETRASKVPRWSTTNECMDLVTQIGDMKCTPSISLLPNNKWKCKIWMPNASCQPVQALHASMPLAVARAALKVAAHLNVAGCKRCRHMAQLLRGL